MASTLSVLAKRAGVALARRPAQAVSRNFTRSAAVLGGLEGRREGGLGREGRKATSKEGETIAESVVRKALAWW